MNACFLYVNVLKVNTRSPGYFCCKKDAHTVWNKRTLLLRCTSNNALEKKLRRYKMLNIYINPSFYVIVDVKILCLIHHSSTSLIIRRFNESKSQTNNVDRIYIYIKVQTKHQRYTISYYFYYCYTSACNNNVVSRQLYTVTYRKQPTILTLYHDNCIPWRTGSNQQY